MDHRALIVKFYTAFQQRNWKAMIECYHKDVTFYDPAFRSLKSQEAKAMWHMLCINAKDFKLSFSDIQVDGNSGSCLWLASYSFSKTGRTVNNRIQAAFTFKDGLIYDHHDEFDLWRWSRMALGVSGVLLGWSPLLKNKINQNARKSLERFMKENL
jgi:ketosteroid isomerase-like protein